MLPYNMISTLSFGWLFIFLGPLGRYIGCICALLFVRVEINEDDDLFPITLQYLSQGYSRRRSLVAHSKQHLFNSYTVEKEGKSSISKACASHMGNTSPANSFRLIVLTSKSNTFWALERISFS